MSVPGTILVMRRWWPTGQHTPRSIHPAQALHAFLGQPVADLMVFCAALALTGIEEHIGGLLDGPGNEMIAISETTGYGGS